MLGDVNKLFVFTLPSFEVMGLNPGYLLKYFLLYFAQQKSPGVKIGIRNKLLDVWFSLCTRNIIPFLLRMLRKCKYVFRYGRNTWFWLLKLRGKIFKIINGHGLKFHPKGTLVVLPKTHLSCNLKKMRLGEVFRPFLKSSLGT